MAIKMTLRTRPFGKYRRAAFLVFKGPPQPKSQRIPRDRVADAQEGYNPGVLITATGVRGEIDATVLPVSVRKIISQRETFG